MKPEVSDSSYVYLVAVALVTFDLALTTEALRTSEPAVKFNLC